MNCYFKKSQFVRFTQFFITLEDSIKTLLGDEMLEPPPILYFCSFLLSSFVLVYVRKYFISKLLSFHHFSGLSMSVNKGYVRMSSCWQLRYDLERRGKMSLGQTLFEFVLPRMQGQHMLPSSDTVSGSLGHSAEGCAFLTFCFKYSSFYCVFETKPNRQTEWNGGKSATAVCFYP